MQESIQYTAPEDFHMRPCAVIASFFLGQQNENKGVSVSLLKKEKSSKATSIINLALLGVKKGDEFSIQIDGGNSEQIERIGKGFAELIETKLSMSHLHETRKELLVPSGIIVPRSNEKHPEYAKFQERYNFLLRAKKILEENSDFFYHPESLSEEEITRKRQLFRNLGQEEEEMVKRHSMTLYDGGKIIGYLCGDAIKDDYKAEQLERVLGYTLSSSIIEAQTHLGILPDEITKPIYHNLKVTIDIRDKIDTVASAEELKGLCDIGLESMIPHDKGDIRTAMGHDFIADYRYYRILKFDGWTEDRAFEKYKKDLGESIRTIIKHVQEFLYPTRLRSYSD